MNYENFLKQQKCYMNICDKRIPIYIKTELQRKRILSTQRDSGFSTRNEDLEDFGYFDWDDGQFYFTENGLELKYEMSYSGCGTESRSFTAPLETFIGDDASFEVYIEKLSQEIAAANEEIEKKQKEKERIIKKVSLESLKKQYEKLGNKIKEEEEK